MEILDGYDLGDPRETVMACAVHDKVHRFADER
jgi:hypothetical protein